MAARIYLRSGMNVVVTGGAGFIGSSLVRKLLEIGCSVMVVDDLSNGKAANLPQHSALSLRQLSICPSSADEISAIIKNADLVYHLASPIGVALAHSARYRVVESILDSGTTVIKACRTHRCPLVITSSSEVYGQGLPRPISETDPVRVDIGARWGYATAKAALEHMAAGLWQDHGVPTWLVRPFNIAGPRQRPETGLVVASFVAAAAAGRPLEIHGDGTQTRSFLHVEDMAEALTAIAFNDSLVGQPVNVGSEAPITIAKLAEIVRQVLNVDVQVIHRPLESMLDGTFAPAQYRIPDITLIKNTTGWYPKRGVEAAAKECFETLSLQSPQAVLAHT
ncbi:MAG: NAD-dependent epimerase/dehydratase family protein [Bacteroidota bacterium]